MPANQYSDSLLMDALRGSLSNAESLGRGFAAAPVGLLGDVNALARQYVTPRLPQKMQSLLESAPAAPTTEQILSNIPRVSNPRMETSGMEQLGAAMNFKGPVDVAKGAGRLAGNAINEAIVYDRGLLAGITPQPMNIMLLHGGPEGVVRVDPSRLTQSVQSSGFHTTNKAQTPFGFATKQNKTTGVVSAFDFPDELYAKTLNYDKPISQSPEVMQAIGSLAQQDEPFRQKLIDEMKTLYKAAKQEGQDTKAEDVMTGKQLHSLMRRHYGGLQQADDALQNAGITGASWQYSAERPNELATAIFPKYAEQLSPLGQYEAAPNSLEEMTRKINADIASRKSLLD
jgi:hypothetical protein